MTKPLKLLLSAVLLAAALVMVFLFLDHRNLSREAASLSSQLSVSRAAWEKTAEEKEKLQETLKLLQNDLKEAELTIKESAERAEELKADIAALQKEIDSMNGEIHQ